MTKIVLQFNPYKRIKYTLTHIKKIVKRDFENSHFFKWMKCEEYGISHFKDSFCININILPAIQASRLEISSKYLSNSFYNSIEIYSRIFRGFQLGNAQSQNLGKTQNSHITWKIFFHTAILWCICFMLCMSIEGTLGQFLNIFLFSFLH